MFRCRRLFYRCFLCLSVGQLFLLLFLMLSLLLLLLLLLMLLLWLLLLLLCVLLLIITQPYGCLVGTGQPLSFEGTLVSAWVLGRLAAERLRLHSFTKFWHDYRTSEGLRTSTTTFVSGQARVSRPLEA